MTQVYRKIKKRHPLNGKRFMVKEMTIKEIQSQSLNILIEFHRFCVQHGIKYSLGGGSLIGAIRHKGFIPWDDDIDIIMPRPEYEKFCESYVNSSEYHLFSPNIGNSYLPFSRLCDMCNTVVQCPVVWTKGNISTGIWIDIFPEDGMPESIEDRSTIMHKSKQLMDSIVYLRCAKELSFSLITRIKYRLKALLKGALSIKSLLTMHKKLATSISFYDSRHFGNFTFSGYLEKEFFHTEDFISTVEVEFEGHRFYALNGYDRHLRDLFGDYMQLPPPEKRVSNHSEHKYFFK